MSLALVAALAVGVPFTLVDHRMFVQAYVDKSGPWSMIVDTGAPDLTITPQVARALRLRTHGKRYVGGAGSGVAAASSVSMRELRLGKLVLRTTRAEVIDLSKLAKAIGFRRLDGIVGYEQMKNFRVLANVERRTLTFSRSAIAVPKDATSQPFTLEDGFIRTRATVDGVRGNFIVDTGDRSSLTLFRGFATANNVYAYAPLHHVVTGYGIGGPIYSDLLRTTFDVFGTTLTGLPTRASRDKGGVFATSTDAGSIGNGLLERFNVVYDYPGQRLVAWPAHPTLPSTSLFRMPDIPSSPSEKLSRHASFGTAVAMKSAGVTVQRVIPASAAAGAGIEPGDVLKSIADAPATTVAYFLSEVHNLHGGDRVIVALERGGKAMTLPVTLGSASDEHDKGLVTAYGEVTVDDTLRRTIVTMPDDATRRLPGLLLVGGIGCYSVDAAANPQDAYLRLTHDVARAGFVTMRLEKSGVGDSQGAPCTNVDFHAELRGYRAALSALLANPHVDASRVYLLAHSIGSVIAPQLSLEQHIAGTIVAEGVGRDWAEYELRNTRRQLELSGASAGDVDAAISEKAQCMDRLLFQDETETQIEQTIASCKVHNGVYPVAASYMQEVAGLNVIAPWALMSGPVLAVYGGSDFVTEEADHQRIVDVVNAVHRGSATYVRIDGMTHQLTRAPNAAAAFADENAGVAEPYDDELSSTVVAWLVRQKV